MPDSHCSSWVECEKRLLELQDYVRNKGGKETLFRGQECYDWDLKTTLDRRIDGYVSISDYYNIIRDSYPEIQGIGSTAAGNEHIPSFSEKPPTFDNDGINLFNKGIPDEPLLVFLRQHGFPSPLLDWTRSPYIATFFAFRNAAARNCRRVAIYALVDTGKGGRGSPEPTSVAIDRVETNIRTHRRHYLQQGAYTYCYAQQRDKRRNDASHGTWRFANHEHYFNAENNNENNSQYKLIKLSVPSSERLSVLYRLDQLNLNAYSLFQTTDSLMEAIALRAMEYKNRHILDY